MVGNNPHYAYQARTFYFITTYQGSYITQLYHNFSN